MIIFKKIKWKNFLSTGNQFIEVDLNKSNTTLVIGTNGSGKSTLLDAMTFVLFNRPFRIIKKEQMINTVNNGEALVEIDFSIGTKQYKVKRGIKPNIFEIYENDELINQDASSVDYQKVLERNIMRLSYRSFIQVVLLGSSSYEPFMKMKSRYRKEAVEEILDIKVFSHMDWMLRDQQSALNKKLIEVKHNADLIKSKHELEEKHYKDIKNRNTDDKTYKEEQLKKLDLDKKNYLEKIQQLDNEYKQLDEQTNDKEKVSKKLSQLEKIETKIEHNLETHNKNLEFFSENDYCPTCTQPIDEQFRYDKQNNIKTKVTTLNEGMKKLVEEISNTEERLTHINKISQKMSDINIEMSKVNTSINELKKFSDNLHNEILLLENKKEDSNKIEQQLNELSEKLVETDTELQKITEEKSYVDTVREILSEKGAKTRIIKKYLPIMNTLINQYLQDMDFFVNFNLDEEFNETIKSRFRDTFNYNNFSEGEKLRIDLALLFTWRQIAKMKNSTNTNVLILDEIFDSSLDSQGTDDFFKILKTLSKENVFIISHKGDILFDKFTNIIKFEKINNFTRLQSV
jgi:DNA repair exonuclease SbcCD ATPase subunit